MKVIKVDYSILRLYKHLIYFALILISIPGYSYNEISFKYLNLSDGLSQSTVLSIEQDSLGRIWIGTREGLNIYSGNDIKTFNPISTDSISLLGFSINNLSIDKHNMWIRTADGISRLNIVTKKLEQYSISKPTCFLPLDGKLLIGTEKGLLELNPKNRQTQQRNDIFNEKLKINYLYKDETNCIWICSNKGLFKYNSILKTTSQICKGNITTCIQDSHKRMWVGTGGDGVILFNKNDNFIKHFYHQNNDSSLTNNIIRDIEEDTNGNIWVGTFLGLSIINGNDLSISNFRHSNKKDNSLSNNSIYCILKDKQGTMWVGTYFGGISYYNPKYTVYKNYNINKGNSEGTGYNVIGKIIEDNNKNLWIATEGGGLDYYNTKTNKFTHYRQSKSGLSHNNVKALLLKDDYTLFIGTHMGGFNIFDLKSGTFTTYKPDPSSPNSIPSDIISCIIPFEGKYLLGTRKGVVLFDDQKKTFSNFFNSKDEQAIVGDNIYCLFQDSFGKLWIGTEKKGLSSYDIKTKELKKYSYSTNDTNSISSNTIYTIFEDHQFRLWIGTFGGGLNKYIRDKDHFTNYTRAKYNIPSDFINGIQESNYGNLWVSTSKGLVRFDVENKKFYKYDKKNGFPLEELNEGSLLLTSRGEVFVGGINGLTSFKEKDILKKTDNYNIILSTLYINNIEQVPQRTNSILTKDLPYTDHITLNSEQNVVTIDYSACNYIPHNKNIFEYKLINFNKDWVNSGTNTKVTYTNLDPGMYTLKVRSLNSINLNIIDETELNITIKPPFYNTWYAYLLYISLITAITIWLNHIYISKIRLTDKLKTEQQEKIKLKELNQSKLRFFTNISHEFRTPLTLIIGTIEHLLENTKVKTIMYNKLLSLNHNAIRLNNLITELLDFRKIEQGFLKLKFQEVQLISFLDEIYQAFIEHSNHHQIDFSLKCTATNLKLWFDPKHMEKVFYNLISNAFKTVKDKTGKVSIEVIEQDTFTDIVISDNSLGLQQEQIDKMFDPFFQVDNITGKTQGQSSGIGIALCKEIIKKHNGQILVKSKLNSGSTFIIRILNGNDHLEQSNIILHPTQEVKLKKVENKYQSDKVFNQSASAPSDAPTILIVEDNAEIRTLLREIFMPHYSILEAKDGDEGLLLSLKKQPNLVISDVMMPKLSGTELCAKIKNNLQTSHIPVILLTAKTALEYKIEGIENGADDYITKPFNAKLLKARVKNLLLNRAEIHQRFRNEPSTSTHEITTTSLDQDFLQKALEIININLETPNFDVAYFAREMGLGRTKLYEKIKGITNQTPHEFILTAKLKKAANLLKNNRNMNISEISYASGFNAPRYFSQCFKEHFGVTPTQYITSKDLSPASAIENKV